MVCVPEPGLQEGEEAPQGPAVHHSRSWFSTPQGSLAVKERAAAEAAGRVRVLERAAAPQARGRPAQLHHSGEMATSEQSSRPASLSLRGKPGWDGLACHAPWPPATAAGQGDPPGSSTSFCRVRGSTMVVAILSLTRVSQ